MEKELNNLEKLLDIIEEIEALKLRNDDLSDEIIESINHYIEYTLQELSLYNLMIMRYKTNSMILLLKIEEELRRRFDNAT